ncbi:MAG: amidohydrolase family protein, partial [Solobacterium sp.]|nr:amidohydrolase family protein [Solobacterium sp.]
MMKYAFRNGTILNGTKDMHPVTGMTVLVEDEHIKDIVPDSTPTEGYETVDLNGGYLLPGLINLHVHLAASGKPPKPNQKPTDYKKLFQLLSGHPLVMFVIKRMLMGYAKTELMSG